MRYENRYLGVAGMFGGVLFVLYLLFKPELLLGQPAIVLPAEYQSQTVLFFHLVEFIPVFLMLLGIVGIYLVGSVNYIGKIGMVIAMLAFVFAIVTHSAEHLLPALQIPQLTGELNLYMYGYYMSWGFLGVGLSLFGISSWQSSTVPRPISIVLIASIPIGIVAGISHGSIGLSSIADGFKLPLAVDVVLAGYIVWLKG